MKSVHTLVIGAGIGGLGAAVWLKHHEFDFVVVDAAPDLPLNLHNGVHYLHSEPPLPFDPSLREITLTDGILSDGVVYHETNLNFSLQYSEKVREIQHPSSIMDIGKRKSVYMPTSNTLNTLLQEMYFYADPEFFLFGWWLTKIDTNSKIAYFSNAAKDEMEIEYENVISTVPLDKIGKITCHEEDITCQLQANPVYVTNYKVDKIVPNWMINLYVPADDTCVYRVSILNGICSVESTREMTDQEMSLVPIMLRMFHVSKEPPERYTWKTGKVMSISQGEREKIVDKLATSQIYQIGRFGLWNRKLLVDSTISQAAAVVEFLKNGDYNYMRNVLIK